MTPETRLQQAPLISLNVGRSRTSVFKGKEAVSAIGKNGVDVPLSLLAEGLDGDEQADRIHHGGPDKAVCVYSLVHYPHWEEVLGRALPYGAFGENFTVDLLKETEVCIGDVYRVGSAALQISQPRVPCWKLAMRWGLDKLPDLVVKSGGTGFYFRVLQPGTVVRGDRMTLEQADPANVSVAEANRIMHREKNDRAGIETLLALEPLAGSWKESLDKRLQRLKTGE
jgi:MOSC domain-containing protein YiiM